MSPSAPAPRPDILLLVSDDQAWSTFNRTLMPGVFSRLVDHGVLFDRAYDSSGLCCPSRSEILTGLWEHHTGVDDNTIPLERPTIVQALHGAGYRTMLAGKYLNSEPCTPRPEFDRWVCAGVAPSSYSLQNPNLNVDGHWKRFPGRYQTDVLASYVRSFVASTPPDEPFFAIYAPTSPHLPANDFRYASLPVVKHHGPSYDENTKADGKPLYLWRQQFSSADARYADTSFRNMAHAVRSLDDSVSSVLGGLGHRAQDTLVIYISDNGYLYGEHRWIGKTVPYDEGVRVPMIVRYPPWTGSAARATNALAANVDVAPTIADAAGLPWGADGVSLRPLLTGPVNSIRDAVLLSRCNGEVKVCLPVPEYWGVVTERYAYIRYGDGEEELYDLKRDPLELHNLARSPAAQVEKATLQQRLEAFQVPPPIQTTIVSGPGATVGGRTVRFVFFSQPLLSTYRCRLTSGNVASGWFPCDGRGTDLGPLAPGHYTFLVYGADGFGHADPTPAQLSFIVSGLAGQPTFSVSNPGVVEGTGVDTPVRFTVSLSRPSTLPVTVRFRTVDDTAHAPAQYAPVSGAFTFVPGQRSASVETVVIGDPVHEPTERFQLQLFAPTNASFVVDRGFATIVDDDPARPCTIAGTNGDDVLVGTAGPDVICGLGGNDRLEGMGGNDVLLGGPGNDVLVGGPGNDVLDGGTGIDTARFDSTDRTHGVTVSLEMGTAAGRETGNDWFVMNGTVSSIENVIGTPGPDTLIGDGGGNGLWGLGGDDVLFGRDGVDGLNGGTGNDLLFGEAGNDVLLPGPGNDQVDGGNGGDFVSYTDLRTGGVTVTLGKRQVTGPGLADSLASIESAIGSPFDDVLLGDGSANILSGQAGNDVLIGGPGDDVLIGGPGDDVLQGGPGNDVAEIVGSDERHDSLTSIEHVVHRA